MKLKIIGLLALLMVGLSAHAKDRTVVGRLVGGGGIDDNSLTIVDSKGLFGKKGRKITAYCKISECDKLFQHGADDLMELKPNYKGENAAVILTRRANNDEIAGPANDEMLYFVKKIKWIGK